MAGFAADVNGLSRLAMPMAVRFARSLLYAVAAYILMSVQTYYSAPPASIAVVVFILAAFQRFRIVAEILLAFLLALVFLPQELVARIAARL